MKKLFAVLILIVILVFFGAPYYTGKVAEIETLKLVNKINQSSTEYGSTEVLSYDRGARSTNARYKYIPPASLAAFSREFGEIIYACDSAHGIMGIDYSCALEGESIYSKFVAEKLNGKDPLSVFGSISAFGGIKQTVALAEIKNLEIDGATLNFPEAVVSLETDTDTTAFQLSGSSDAFQMQGNGEMIYVGEATIKANFKRLADLLFTGHMLIELEQFKASGAQGETSFKGLSVSSITSEQGETLSSNVVFSVEQVVVPAMPLESIEDLAASVDFKGLDKQALIDYQILVQEIQRDALASIRDKAGPQRAGPQRAGPQRAGPNKAGPQNTEPQIDPAQMAKLMPVVEKMLKQGLEISSKINAKLDGELSKVAFKLALLEPLSLAQMPKFLTNPDEALRKLDVSLDASLNKALIDRQPLGTVFIAQSPLFAARADDYALNLKLGQKIELNGKPMSFSELQILLISSKPF